MQPQTGGTVTFWLLCRSAFTSVSFASYGAKVRNISCIAMDASFL